MMSVGRKVLEEEGGISKQHGLLGFHVPPFISVPHLHMHVIAPRDQIMFKRIKYITWPPVPWFITADNVLARLQKKQDLTPSCWLFWS
mmetsp:Transcript_6539/g.10361  ORF Transcript_6539/g.10361 Transcript_6539/m.10361 type:complete len:88 (+) Transcript_6539:314-577(+)